MHHIAKKTINGGAVSAFGAGVLCALLLPRLLLGILGGAMLVAAGYIISKHSHKES